LQSTFKTLFAQRRRGKALYASLRIRQTKKANDKMEKQPHRYKSIFVSRGCANSHRLAQRTNVNS